MVNLLQTEKPLEDLNPRQLKFLKHYMKNDGNATKAYMQAFRLTNEASAAVLGSRLLKKLKREGITLGLFEKHGLGEMTIIKAIKDASKAIKQQYYYGKSYETPDHFARLKAAELYLKLTE